MNVDNSLKLHSFMIRYRARGWKTCLVQIAQL